MVIFPELSEGMVEQVQMADEITVTLRAISPTAACPYFGTVVKWVHSRYTRHLHDLPSGERTLHLRVEVRGFVCNIATKPLNKIFASLCSQIQTEHSAISVSRVKAVLQTKGYPKDTEFRARLLDAKLYGTGDRATKTKLILEALEESFQHKEAVPFDTLTIEHVMPQTLTEYWQNHLGQDWETTRELLLHTLGNLTLTAYNSELSNDTWEMKKELLSRSHLELNEYFKNKRVWGREDIEQRSAYLAEIALRVWPYFGDEKTEQNGQKTVTGPPP